LLVPANSEDIKKKQELREQINSAAPALKQIPKGMALIPNGEFIGGTTSKEAQKVCLKNNDYCKEKWFEDEEPLHSVKLSSYYLDIHEVTQKDYQRLLEKKPSQFKESNLPVGSVTWYEVVEYCKKTGKRLPTEAEWKWAARGGKQLTFAWGNEAESHRANFCDRSCDKRWKEKQFEDGYSHTARLAVSRQMISVCTIWRVTYMNGFWISKIKTITRKSHMITPKVPKKAIEKLFVVDHG
jgi:formylglycine-generating enzyme